MLQERHSISRRTFLRTSAAAMGGAAVAPTLLAASALAGGESWKMRLSTSSVQFSSLPVEKACERIAALGFEAIDIWPGAPKAYADLGCPHLEQIEKRLGPAGLKELLDKHHLKLCAVTCYFVGYRKYAELLGKMGGGVAVRELCFGKVTNPRGNEGFLRATQARPGTRREIRLLPGDRKPLGRHAVELPRLVQGVPRHEPEQPDRDCLAALPFAGGGHFRPRDHCHGGKTLVLFLRVATWSRFEPTARHRADRLSPWLAALAKVDYPRYVNPFMHGHPQPDQMAAAWRPRATTCRSVTTKSSCSRVGWVERKGTKLALIEAM